MLRNTAARIIRRGAQYGRCPATFARKAFALLLPLQAEHWDNCKVRWNRRTAFCYAHAALWNGHEAERIVRCYARALFTCRGLATDQGASQGEIVFFNVSSTVVKARKLLAKDGLARRERIRRWHERHQLPPAGVSSEEAAKVEALGLDPEELARVRALIAVTFPK